MSRVTHITTAWTPRHTGPAPAVASLARLWRAQGRLVKLETHGRLATVMAEGIKRRKAR